MPSQYNTGLEGDDLRELERRVQEVLYSRPSKRGGPKIVLTTMQQIEVTLCLLRHNVTEEFLAHFYHVSQSTISRVKDRIEPVLDEVLAFNDIGLAQAKTGRTVVVDGTYVPTGNRTQTGKENYSGKRKCQCVNIQVACDLDGLLLAVSGTTPGRRHDSKALELTGWKDELITTTWIADTAYIGIGAITPIKKQPGIDRHPADAEFNKQVSSLRSVVERCIGHLKNWKILHYGYRRQLKKLADLIRLVSRLELYRLGW